jgi:hypothetical protein
VFIDYNQNARDRTVASAYSVRPTPDARVSCPVTWDELPDCELGDFTIETVPKRIESRGDASAAIDDVHFSLEPLLELVARQEREGLGDAPWPPQFPKAPGEPMRVQPSRARQPRASGGEPKGRRQSNQPVVIVAKAERRDDAFAGLEGWKARHPQAAAFLQPDDVLVDSMRGRSSTWTRIRLNLRHVPEEKRPAEEAPDPDYDPWANVHPASPPAMRTPYRRPKS